MMAGAPPAWRRRGWILALASTAWLAAAPAAASGPALEVVASFSILADMAANVGGEHVAITALVGPDADIHAYEPRPADAAVLRSADVILVNGLGLEGFLPRLVAASGSRAPVVELTRGIDPLPGGAAQGGKLHGAADPHAWQSVANAEIYVRNIADAFCAADPAHCADYRRNASRYTAELRALDAEITAQFAALPSDRRSIIAAHDAFAYFGSAYGLQILAPEGISRHAEASAADVAALIRQARSHHVAALFVENIADPRLIQQIARDAGARVGGKLHSDALSAAGTPASTYVGMMRANAEAIAEAFGAPDRP